MSVARGPSGGYPFSPQPLRWAVPPGTAPGDLPGAVPSPTPSNPVGSPLSSLPVASLSTVSFAVRGSGVVGTAFPALTRVGVLTFRQVVVIMGVSLTSSIVNASVSDACCLIVHKDNGLLLSVSNITDVFAEHIVEQGLSHSIRTGTSFTDNIAPSFSSNESMALYAVMPAAGCVYSALVTIRYLTT